MFINIYNILTYNDKIPGLNYGKYIVSMLPYIRNFRENKSEELILEKKLMIEGVCGGTPDWIKKISNTSCLLTDYKTLLKISSAYNNAFKDKYNMQLCLYSDLIKSVLGLTSVSNNLFYISENGCAIIKQKPLNIYKIRSMCLIFYFHYLNKSLYTKEMIDFTENNFGILNNIIGETVHNNGIIDKDFKGFYNELLKITKQHKHNTHDGIIDMSNLDDQNRTAQF